MVFIRIIEKGGNPKIKNDEKAGRKDDRRNHIGAVIKKRIRDRAANAPKIIRPEDHARKEMAKILQETADCAANHQSPNLLFLTIALLEGMEHHTRKACERIGEPIVEANLDKGFPAFIRQRRSIPTACQLKQADDKPGGKTRNQSSSVTHEEDAHHRDANRASIHEKSFRIHPCQKIQHEA